MGSEQMDGEDITKAIRYEIVGTVNTFRCELEEERGIEIEYYQGKAFIDGEHEVDVTFIVQTLDLELVKRRFFQLQSVKHSRLMHPHFYIEYDKKTLICYDKIESFLTDEIRKQRVQIVNNGEPNDVTACDIRELSMGLEEIHKNDLSCFDLACSRRYVISKGKIKFCNNGVSAKDTKVKIEEEDKQKKAKAERDWDNMLKKHIRYFGNLVQWLLSTDKDVEWPEKDSFLLCFKQVAPRDLRVIYAHPFLMRNKKYAFQILADADHALNSQDNDVRDYTSLINKVSDKAFGEQIMEGKWWWPNKFDTEDFFNKVLWYGSKPYPTSTRTSDASSNTVFNTDNTETDTLGASSSTTVPIGTTSGIPTPRTTGQPQKDFGQPKGESSAVTPKCNYSPTRLRDLIRFLRNVYEHYHETTGIKIEYVHGEIKRHWPKLIDTVHVESWTTA